MKHLAAKLAVLGVAGAVVLGVTTASASASFSLKGAGSTLVAPISQNVWIPDFQSRKQRRHCFVQRRRLGHGHHRHHATSRRLRGVGRAVDLRRSNQRARIACKYHGLCARPVPCTTCPRVPNLNLSGKVLAEIYLGRSQMWNDPAIKALNKGVALPSEAITPVWRNDGSGDSYVFRHSCRRAIRRSRPAFGAVQHTARSRSARAPKGSSGVTAAIASTPGAVGYISTYYAHQANLHGAAIENPSGKFVHPYPTNMTDAAALVPNSALVANTQPVIPNYVAKAKYIPPKVKKGQKAKKPTALQLAAEYAYPMATFSDVLVRPDSADIPDLQTFIKFCLSSTEQSKGGTEAVAPLPKAVVTFDLSQVSKL